MFYSQQSAGTPSVSAAPPAAVINNPQSFVVPMGSQPATYPQYTAPPSGSYTYPYSIPPFYPPTATPSAPVPPAPASPPIELVPATPSPPAPSLTKKRPAPDDDIQELDGPSAKRAGVDGVDATGAVPFTPSKRRRLEEDGLIMLDSAEEKIEEDADPDVIEID